MKPHLNREFINFQSWKVDLQKRKYALLTTSLHNISSIIKVEKLDKKQHTVKADSYQEHYLIEYGNHHKLRIIHLNRIDLKYVYFFLFYIILKQLN